MSSAKKRPASSAHREGRPAPPDGAAISASSGSANARRQNPAAAGPVSDSRTRIADRPITQAPKTSTASACQRRRASV
jgi:hypothetical protein